MMLPHSVWRHFQWSEQRTARDSPALRGRFGMAAHLIALRAFTILAPASPTVRGRLVAPVHQCSELPTGAVSIACRHPRNDFVVTSSASSQSGMADCIPCCVRNEDMAARQYMGCQLRGFGANNAGS